MIVDVKSYLGHIKRFKVRANKRAPLAFSTFLVQSRKPTLVHSGEPWMEERLLEFLIQSQSLAYICVMHIEGDECGNIAALIKRYPDVKILCTRLAANALKAIIPDVVQGKIVSMSDGEKIDLGESTIEMIATPHVPHGWESCCFGLSLGKQQVLFSGDLGTQHAEHENFNLESQKEMIHKYGYLSVGEHLRQAVQRMQEFSPSLTLPMHGPEIRVTEMAEFWKFLKELA